MEFASASVAADSAANYRFGRFRIDSDGTLYRDNAIVHLAPRELAALRFLLAHGRSVISHQQLKQALWGEVHVTADSVPKCMSSLRAKLGADDCIETVYKRGYRLAADIRTSTAPAGNARPRLAIMPFANGVNVPEFLGEAISEETISLLTSDPAAPVRMVARDSVFALAEHGFSAQQIGEKLQVDLVLTGTVRARQNHYRLRVEMVRVEDGTQIWVEDMMLLQSRFPGVELELAQRLLSRLCDGDSLNLAAAAEKAGAEFDSIRSDAHVLLLRGHREWQSRNRHRMQDGLDHLTRAIELDPSLVAAHIDRAHACITQAIHGFIDPLMAAQRVRLSVESMPATAEGAKNILPSLGWVRFHVDRDLTGALKAFAAGAHLPKKNLWLRSLLALSRQRFDEAISLLQTALQDDPFSPWLSGRMAWAWHLAGESEKSVEQIHRALEVFPDHAGTGIYGAIILGFNGDTRRALRLAESLARQSPYSDVAIAVLGQAQACAGRTDEAREALERLQWLSRERFVMRSFNPALCLALGDGQGAMDELRAANDARCPWFFQMLADPRLQSLQELPEFKKMRQILPDMEASAAQRSVQEEWTGSTSVFHQ